MIAPARSCAAALACVVLFACGSDDDSSAGTNSSSGTNSAAKPHSKASTKRADAASEQADAASAQADAASEQADAAASDAGTSSSCDSRDCWCEMSCANIAAVACPDDQPQADCEKQCKMPMDTACAAQDLALVKCQATRPKTAFSCDLDQHVYTVKGCESQQDAVTNCLFSM